MSVLDPRTPVDDLARLDAELRELKRRLDLLEAPTGTSAFRTVAKLEGLVNDIQAELDAYMATRYTNAQVDAKDAAVSSSILPTIQNAGTLALNGALVVPNAYNTDITWTRRTGWWGNDGRAGYASSSRRKKIGIKPADVAHLLALLDVEPMSFFYRAEISRRTRLRINDGIDYAPGRELGLIAEDLDAVGLSEFVYYDEDGQAEGIEYGMLTVALLAIAREQRRELDEIRERLDRMESDR